MSQYSPIINTLLKITSIVSSSLIRDFGEVENLQVSRKGAGGFVSTADLKAEKIIIKELQRAYPDYSILSEEVGFIKGSDPEYRWIVDPLDGTTNFLHGFPLFCTTIALERTLPNRKTEIIAAVTRCPATGETFWAEKGSGAWLERDDRSGGERLRIAARTKLNTALLAIGSCKNDTEIIQKLTYDVAAIRSLGATALGLAYVAAGRMDCFVQSNVETWDMAAGVLLISEAGGYVSDMKDKKDMFKSRSIVAANDDIHREIFKKLRSR